MLENAFKYDFLKRIAIDPIYPPPHESKWPIQKKEAITDDLYETNRFELIFDDLVDGQEIINAYENVDF